MFVPMSSVLFPLFFIAVEAVSLFQNLSQNSSLGFQEYLLNYNLTVSEECSRALQDYASSLLAGKLWALKMFDAAGKLPSGIISGNSGDFGAYDQCLEVKAVTEQRIINGKYCLGRFYVAKAAQRLLLEESQRGSEILMGELSMGSCLPDACAAADFQEFYSTFGLEVVYSEYGCQTKDSQPELDSFSIGTIAFFGVLLCVMIFSTAYDVFIYYTRSETRHTLAIAFSAFTNGRKLLQISKNPEQISCLHGLRVISIMWIMLGHRYKMYMNEVSIANQLHMLKWVTNSPYMTGAAVAVDTFFFMSGLVVSYVFMGAMAKTPRFNVFMFYLHRYIRLTPAYAAAILVNISLMKHLASGPQWPASVQKFLEQPCRNYWWSALLYVQNYVNPLEPCMGQTWYLSVDTQLFLFSPLLLIPFYRWPKIRPYALGVLIVCAGLIPFSIAWFNEFIAMMDPYKTEEYIRKLYYPTYARSAPWLVGFSTGYILYESKQFKFSRNYKKAQVRILNLVMWVATLTVLCACVFGANGIINGEYNRFSHSLYTGFVPLSWSIGLSFLVFSCVHGYGGPVNWFLSNPLMQVTSKLSYCIYLLHKAVLSFQIYRARRPLIFGDIEIMTAFWGDFMFTAVLAILWVLAFESPIIVIEKVIFHRKPRETS